MVVRLQVYRLTTTENNTRELFQAKALSWRAAMIVHSSTSAFRGISDGTCCRCQTGSLSVKQVYQKAKMVNGESQDNESAET